MSQDQDNTQKTEEPTQRRLDQAREKGQVAKSQEVTHWFMILAFGIILTSVAPYTVQRLYETMYPFIGKVTQLPTGRAELGTLLEQTIWDVIGALFVPFLVAMLAAVASIVLQIGFLLSPESLKPKLEKISLIKGAGRLFSSRSLVEFAKGIGKLTIVGLVVTLMLIPEHDRVNEMPLMPVNTALPVLRELTLKIVGGILAVMTVIAVIDFAFQKMKHHEQMKMTKQEVKDEQKQTEGDPEVKKRLGQLRKEKGQKRMMAEVPEADAVVTNPTQYAVALKYDQVNMAAPTLVAKGTDRVAERIRTTARENDVPIVPNPPLARALYSGVEIDQEIPPEHYKAVAQIIGYVMRLKGRTPGGRNAGR